MRNLLSVDVEDYFHPSEIQQAAGASDWDALPSRVEQATGRVLDLLARRGTRATFFILGWVAEKHPRLVRRIAAAGHEIGCHSHRHRLVYDLTREEFVEDTQRAISAIVGACGARPAAYRAPSFSITKRSLWALEALVELGFTIDSSIYPVSHDRYGIVGHPRGPHYIETSAGAILEIPAAAAELSRNRVIPVGGGGYLRLLPYRYTAAGIRRINESDRWPACVYFHPWEIDPEQPKLASSAISRWRTYLGLGAMETKLRRLLWEFDFCPLGEGVENLELLPRIPARGG